VFARRVRPGKKTGSAQRPRNKNIGGRGMIIRKTICALFLTAGLAALMAAPKLKIDNMTFNGGSVAEGRDTVVKAVFKLTNTGNEPLKLTSVRPGCGCTVVKYDSIIAPGKTGVIEPVVNIKGFRPGHMSRGVTVTSNDADNPSVSLTIEANIVPIIDVSENYLEFYSAGKKSVYLSSAKRDLKVASVVFKPQQGSGANIPGWASNVPLNLKYSFAPSDSARADGLKVYKLDIDSPPGTSSEPVAGEILISTNHPDRKEIVIRGRAQ